MYTTFYAVYLALIISPFLGMITLLPYLIKTYEKNKTIYAKESLYFYLLAIALWGGMVYDDVAISFKTVSK